MEESKKYFEAAIAEFEALRDDANVALVVNNLGRNSTDFWPNCPKYTCLQSSTQMSKCILNCATGPAGAAGRALLRAGAAAAALAAGGRVLPEGSRALRGRAAGGSQDALPGTYVWVLGTSVCHLLNLYVLREFLIILSIMLIITNYHRVERNYLLFK